MKIRTWYLSLPTLFIIAAFAATYAGTIGLQWDPVTDPDLAGYKVYSGPGPGLYNQVKEVSESVTQTDAYVPDCQEGYVAVKSVDTEGEESLEFSNEVFGWPAPVVVVAQDSNTGGNRFKVPRGNQPWDYTVTVKGLNFPDGSTVLFSGTGVEVLSVSVESCNELTATIRTTSATALGLSDVEVRHPDNVFGVGVGLVEFYHGPSQVGGAQRLN